MDIHEIVAKTRKISVFNNIYDKVRLIRDSRHSFEKFGVKGSKLLFQHIKEAHQLYGWYPDEYFLYHYDELTDAQRQLVIGDREHSIIAEAMNDRKAAKLLSDKWETFCLYRPYFQRDAVRVTKEGGFSEFQELLKQKGRLILKPIDGTFGKGIQIVIAEPKGYGLLEKLHRDYPMGFIAEEVIEQDPRVAILHPESVNTMRVITICYNNKVEVLRAFIRIGRGKSVVDNASSSGFLTACNQQTGEILTVMDKKAGHIYSKHPDTGCQLIGFRVPRWEEALDLAKELALQQAGIHYAGWDLALTKSGWVMVEGNPRAQMGFQISEQRGVRDDLVNLLDKFDVSYPDVRFKPGRKTF